MTPKEKAIELFEEMGIEKVKVVTSVIPKPEATYHGWANGKYAKQCALIAVREIIKSVDYLDTPYWESVKQEIEKL